MSSFFHPVPCLAFCTSGGLSPLCFPALTFGRPLHCTGSRLRVRRRNFIFFSPPVLFQIFHSQDLHQMKAPSVSQRDFPKLSFTALPLTYSKGRSYKPQNLPGPGHWHIIAVCLVKCHGKSWQVDTDPLCGVSDSHPSHQPTCGHHKFVKSLAGLLFPARLLL